MNRFFFIIIMIIFTMRIFSETTHNKLIFEKEKWSIGIESFSGNSLQENDYLKISIPDLIKKELISSTLHQLSVNEIDYYRKKVISRKKKEIINDLQSKYGKRDNFLFDKKIESSINELNKEINFLKTLLEELGQVDLNLIKTADLLPVEWVNSDDKKELFEADLYNGIVVSEIYKLDFLISGRIKKIDDYYLLEVLAFKIDSAEKILVYSELGSTEDLQVMAVKAANELRSIILGRPWSKLIVESNNPEVLIYKDGDLIGVGRAEVNTLSPKTVFLEAIGDDNSYWSGELELIPLELNRIEAQLSQSNTELISLDSNPSNADVYIGSQWAGKTPISLPRYGDKSIWISIKSDGYYDRSFELSPQSADSLIFELEVEGLTRLENFEIKKKQFYDALGWFSVSVAGPVIMGGIYSNFASRQNSYVQQYISYKTSDPGLATQYYNLSTEMNTNYQISFGIFWGTFAVSGGLLVNMFVQLSEYIKAAEAMVE